MRHLAIWNTLAAATLASTALGGDLSPVAEYPAGDQYRIQLTFEIDQIVPEIAGTRTRVDFDSQINIRLVDIAPNGALSMRYQMDQMSIKYQQDASVAVVGFRFDSEQGQDFNGDAEGLKEFIGQLVEFRVGADLSEDDMLNSIKLMFARDDAGNFFRMFLSERLFSQSLPYIFGLAGDASDVEVGDSFTTILNGRLIGEATVHFNPTMTYTQTDGSLAHLTIDGNPTITDRRASHDINDGKPSFSAFVSSNVSGGGVWNVQDHLLESLNITAEAFLEPAEIDPLGRRIERRRLKYGIQIDRIAPSQ